MPSIVSTVLEVVSHILRKSHLISHTDTKTSKHCKTLTFHLGVAFSD